METKLSISSKGIFTRGHTLGGNGHKKLPPAQYAGNSKSKLEQLANHFAPFRHFLRGIALTKQKVVVIYIKEVRSMRTGDWWKV